MRTAKITDSVYYIGVNDRTTERFEALWPLPYGVSYNSYVVKGDEKIAVIDGVEASYALQQIDHINDLFDGRHPDYLVINHMEPDHSGAIRILRQAYPDMIIVGNRQTLEMVRGFYGLDNNTLEVKDGDRLDLGGGKSLEFRLTPMVHWPETMMTLYDHEHVLFSGDAFGCFGALNGAVIDRDMNCERYFPEMVRYYSNIVGKYGQFVQRAIARFADVRIQMICSTHGPVWTERVGEVVTLYDRLSRYEPLDNGVTVVYGSMYGNTGQMAEAVADALASAGVKDIEVFNASVTPLSYILEAVFRHKGLIIASPTYSATVFPPVSAFVDALTTRGVKNRVVGLMGSHTWAQQALKEMLAKLSSAGIEPCAPAVTVKQAPGENAFAEIATLARAVASEL